MKFMAMKLRFVLFAIALSVILGCQADKSKLNPIGLWADSTGMALFEVKHEKGEAFSVSSSIGSLKGKWIDGSVRGVTDLNDSFSMSILSDSTAVYSVLGVQIEYRRVSQAKYDSLAKLLAQ